MEDRLEEFRRRFLEGESLIQLEERKGRRKKPQEERLAFQALD